MPKCGGSPASIVEKAIAWGSVTTASVSPTSRLARTAGSKRGRALRTAFIRTKSVGCVRRAVAAESVRMRGRARRRGRGARVRRALPRERVRVSRQNGQEVHHHLLPGGHQRPLLIAG